GAMYLPHQAERLRQCVRRRRVSVVDRKKSLVPIDREIGRQSHWRRRAILFQLQVAIEDSIEKSVQKLRVTVSQGQSKGLPVPAGLAVPLGGEHPELLTAVADVVIAKGEDQLATDARIGVVRERSEPARRLDALHVLGARILDLAIVADIAAEY